MPLNLSVGDGDFTPFIKYNAKAGRFYVRPEGATEEVEIVNPLLAFDMANIRTGWLYYAEGSGPEKVWDPSATQMAPNPSTPPKKFKRGFEVAVFGNIMIPGTTQKLGLREFSSTANNVISAVKRMYDEYEEGLKANQNCVPVYVCNGVKPITGQYGVNYEPLFTLQQWVSRSRVPAFDEATHHHTEPAGNGYYAEKATTRPPMQHVVTDRPGYKLSEMRPVPEPIEEATGVRTRNASGGPANFDDSIPFAPEFR